MIIGYDLNNTAAQTELISRQYELRDFVRNYFNGKYVSDLQPDNEKKLKADIRQTLNDSFLDTARVRIILFDKFDVNEMY
jgi:flagellar FliL protein